MPLRPWILAARPKTLPAAVAPVLVGSALAYRSGAFAWLPAFLCLLFALLIQVATNFANDYFDFSKGADTVDRIGPTRAVSAGLIKPGTMKGVTGLTFLLAFLIGLALIPFGGWWLLGIGVASVLCGYAYTAGPLPLAYVGLGDVFVLFFFGLVAVNCTYFVQAGTFTGETLLVATAVGALSTNLLVVNNLRDIDTDRLALKRTLAVRLGRRFSIWQYRVLLLWAYLVVEWVAFHLSGLWPHIPLLTLPLAWVLWQGLGRAETGNAFNRLLAGTALLLVLYSFLLSLSLVW